MKYCEYCSGNKPLAFNVNYVKVFIEKHKIIINDKDKLGHMEIAGNFCPMCGKRINYSRRTYDFEI